MPVRRAPSDPPSPFSPWQFAGTREGGPSAIDCRLPGRLVFLGRLEVGRYLGDLEIGGLPAPFESAGQSGDLRVGEGPPLVRAKAGMGVPGRPSWITLASTSSGTMARKSPSLSGGAGPSRPVAPWQPEQFSA